MLDGILYWLHLFLESEFFLPVLFLVAAAKTRKDIAIYAAIVSWLGLLVYSRESWAIESTLMAFAALNCSLAVFSAYHYKAFGHKLGLVSTLIATAAVTNNLAQVVTFTGWSVTVSEVLAWLLLIALISLPGRKGWVNEVAMDCSPHRRSGVRHHSHASGSGGDQ